MIGESIAGAVHKIMASEAKNYASIEFVRLPPSSKTDESYLSFIEGIKIASDTTVIFMGGSSMFLTPMAKNLDAFRLDGNHVIGAVNMRDDDMCDIASNDLINALNSIARQAHETFFVGPFPRLWKACCDRGDHFFVNFVPEEHLERLRDYPIFLQRSNSLLSAVRVVNLQSLFGPSILTGTYSLKDQIHLNKLAIRRLAVGILELIKSPESAPIGLYGDKLMSADIGFIEWHKAYLANSSEMCAPVTICKSLENILNSQPSSGDSAGAKHGPPMRRDRSDSRSSSSRDRGRERGRGGRGGYKRSNEYRREPYPTNSGGGHSRQRGGRRGSGRGHNWSWS